MESLQRDGPIWVTTGTTMWRGNEQILSQIPTVTRLPWYWEVNDDGIPEQPSTNGKPHIRTSTGDERRCREQIMAGFEPPEISQVEINPIRAGQPNVWMPRVNLGNAEEEEFGT